MLELEAAANIGRSASTAKTFQSAGYPDFHIRLHDAHGSELVEMVHSGEIDVALSPFSQAAPGVRRVPLVRFSAGSACIRWWNPIVSAHLNWLMKAYRGFGRARAPPAFGAPPESAAQSAITAVTQRRQHVAFYLQIPV